MLVIFGNQSMSTLHSKVRMYFDKAVMPMTSAIDSADQNGKVSPYPSFKDPSSMGTSYPNHFFVRYSASIHIYHRTLPLGCTPSPVRQFSQSGLSLSSWSGRSLSHRRSHRWLGRSKGMWSDNISSNLKRKR